VAKQPINLIDERLRRAFTKLMRTGAALDLEMRKSKRDVAVLELVRNRRQQKENPPAPQLTVVTKGR
jgi:hypothetical protein